MREGKVSRYSDTAAETQAHSAICLESSMKWTGASLLTCSRGGFLPYPDRAVVRQLAGYHHFLTGYTPECPLSLSQLDDCGSAE